MIQEKEQEKVLDFIKKVQRDILFKFQFFIDEIDGLCPNTFYGLTEEELCREIKLKAVDIEDIKESYKKVFHSYKCFCFNHKFMFDNKKYPFETRDKTYAHLEEADQIRLDAFEEKLVRDAVNPSENLLSLLCDKRMQEFIF